MISGVAESKRPKKEKAEYSVIRVEVVELRPSDCDICPKLLLYTSPIVPPKK